MTSDSRSRLAEVFFLFLRLGVTAFGGPAAHIAMMERETVQNRKWLTSEEFMDLLGATHLIPGPNSTELAMHLGYRRAGVCGLWIAGTAFILPAAVLVAGMAELYRRWGTLPTVGGLLYGVKAVMISVVVQSGWVLGKTALRERWLVAVAVAVFVLRWMGIHELYLLAGAGVIGLSAYRSAGTAGVVLPLVGINSILNALSNWVASLPLLLRLFLIFLKIGSLLYGSGYVLLAFLQSDLVDRLQWVTSSQLIDAVAVGQATPGPVLTTATFLGYLVDGPTGAIAATVGIFLPAFLFVLVTCQWLPRLRKNSRFGPFVDGVNAASLGLLGAVAVELGKSALVDLPSAWMAIVSFGLLLRTRVNSVWLLVGAGILGWLWQHLHPAAVGL